MRAAAPRVADLLEWRDWECQHKVVAIERLAAQGGTSVVVTGPSLVNSAFDPHLATELLGSRRPAFNAALNAASMRTLALWVGEVLLPKLRPELLVLGLNSSEFNDNNLVGQRGFDMFRDSLGWRRIRRDGSFWQRVLVGVEKRSFLVRYRHFLREPGRWGLTMSFADRWRLLRKDFRHRFSRDRGKKAGVTPLGKLFALARFEGSPYQVANPRTLDAWQRIVQSYEVGGHELAALGGLVDRARATGTDVLIVRMPVTRDWIDLHPNGNDDYELFERSLEAFVATREVPLLDVLAEFPSLDEYTDAAHLNEAGRERFTRIVCTAAADLLGTVSERSDGSRP